LPREYKTLVEETAIIYLSQGEKKRDRRTGTKIMTDDPLYYTEQELDDLFKERAAFAERIKAIGKEVQGLIANRHQLIAKTGAVADQQAQVAKQAHEAENVDLKSVFELNKEMDALFDEWYTTEIKLDELKSELTHSKNMMDDILKDTLRDPRMHKLYDEMKNE
jgi:hypothetical protein